MRGQWLWLFVFGTTMSSLGAWAGITIQSRGWRLDPPRIGRAAAALRAPDRAFHTQISRGWQIVNAPVVGTGERSMFTVSDGVYWNFELRALVKREDYATPLVAFIIRYENSDTYGALLWDTKTGDLTLRSLRQNRATDLAKGKASFGDRSWASVVVRAVMQDVVCYINGEKVLTGKEPSFLGRVGVVVVGGEPFELDGLEVRNLRETDADVFARSRSTFETKCVTCHELDGPWNSHFAPDDWESVVNEMMYSEGAAESISRNEASAIIDYLRIIGLHPDRNHYRPGEWEVNQPRE